MDAEGHKHPATSAATGVYETLDWGWSRLKRWSRPVAAADDIVAGQNFDDCCVKRRPGRRRSTKPATPVAAVKASATATHADGNTPFRNINICGVRGGNVKNVMSGLAIFALLVLLLQDAKEGELLGISRRWKSYSGENRRSGLFSTILVSAATSSSSAAESHHWSEGGVVVPLKAAGFQYTTNVSISEGNFTLRRTLVVDTMTSAVGVRDCEGEEDSASDAGGVGGSDCITLQDGETQRQVIGDCSFSEADYGTVCFCPNICDCDDSNMWLTEVAREVTLRPGEGTPVPKIWRKILMLPNISTESDSSTLAGWVGADGVFGLATYPAAKCVKKDSNVEVQDRSVFGSMLFELTDLSSGDEYRELFALDIGDESYDSTLEIGGYAASEHTLHWGERNLASLPNSWYFTAFDLSVCGRSVLNNISSSWPAVISTRSACLGLPRELFDSLMAWVPVIQETRPSYTDEGRSDTEEPTCHVTNTTAANELPWLSFRLSEGGEPLYIPLSSLLISDGSWGTQRLCITRQTSIIKTSAPIVYDVENYVTVGTLALRSLYAVVDVENGRVGLAQKNITGSTPELGERSCKQAANCTGSEKFEESANECTPPSCSLYFFYHLDEDTMTCRARGGLRGLAWILGIGFGVIELAGHFLRAYYGGTGCALRGHRRQQGWEFQVGKVLEYGLEKASTFIVGVPSDRRDD